MAHLMKAIELDLMPVAYRAAAIFWSYPILMILAIGTWRGHRRMTGNDQASGAGQTEMAAYPAGAAESGPAT
jgi:hypothetical protein